MSAPVIPFPAIPLDANGLPVGHAEARDAAVREFCDHVNELPESVYHMGKTDAEWCWDNAFARYLSALKRGRR